MVGKVGLRDVSPIYAHAADDQAPSYIRIDTDLMQAVTATMTVVYWSVRAAIEILEVMIFSSWWISRQADFEDTNQLKYYEASQKMTGKL